jgi:hypothetical protein
MRRRPNDSGHRSARRDQCDGVVDFDAAVRDHEPTFPRKRIFTTIRNIHYKPLIYLYKVSPLAIELAVYAIIFTDILYVRFPVMPPRMPLNPT